MECGKLTAKLRDAVPVCFMVAGKEVKRFKNIEIPDEIKQLPFIDFKFDVPMNGAITFKIMFEEGVLPAKWPDARQRKTRGSKPIDQSSNTAPENAETKESPNIPDYSVPDSIAYNVTGERRKALVEAISSYTGERAVYQNAPSFAYHIGPFAVDKNGKLTGPLDHSLIDWLVKEGFPAEE